MRVQECVCVCVVPCKSKSVSQFGPDSVMPGYVGQKSCCLKSTWSLAIFLLQRKLNILPKSRAELTVTARAEAVLLELLCVYFASQFVDSNSNKEKKFEE